MQCRVAVVSPTTLLGQASSSTTAALTNSPMPHHPVSSTVGPGATTGRQTKITIACMITQALPLPPHPIVLMLGSGVFACPSSPLANLNKSGLSLCILYYVDGHTGGRVARACSPRRAALPAARAPALEGAAGGDNQVACRASGWCGPAVRTPALPCAGEGLTRTRSRGEAARRS